MTERERERTVSTVLLLLLSPPVRQSGRVGGADSPVLTGKLGMS